MLCVYGFVCQLAGTELAASSDFEGSGVKVVARLACLPADVAENEFLLAFWWIQVVHKLVPVLEFGCTQVERWASSM